MKQKEIFLKTQGNAYLKRNKKKVQPDKLPKSDFLLVEILDLNLPSEGVKVLEIGCGNGTRLSSLKENCGFECYGLDPSYEVVKVAKSRGIIAHQGTEIDCLSMTSHLIWLYLVSVFICVIV